MDIHRTHPTAARTSPATRATGGAQREAMRDCIVVGGGPAGLLAAIYLKRFLRDVLIVDAGESRTRYITATRNCPGFPGGISGSELVARLREQAVALEVDTEQDRVLRLVHAGEGFRVEARSRSWPARTVIAASGVRDRLPAWPGIEDAILAGVVRLCAVCDGYEAEDRRIAVYGTADECVPHARFMRTYSSRVTAIHPRGTPPSAADRALAAAMGITLLGAAEGECSLGDGFGVTLPGEPQRRFDLVYIAMGANSQTAWLDGLGVLMQPNGDIQVDAHGESSVTGVYAIGDAVNALNQISVAFGHAAIAASAVHNRLPRNPRVALAPTEHDVQATLAGWPGGTKHGSFR